MDGSREGSGGGMGEVSHEQLDDILSSIRRVIARGDTRVDADTANIAGDAGTPPATHSAVQPSPKATDVVADPQSPVLRKRRTNSGAAGAATASTMAGMAVNGGPCDASVADAAAAAAFDAASTEKNDPDEQAQAPSDDDDVLLLGPASLAVTAPDGSTAPLISDLGVAATRHALETLNAAVHPARDEAGGAANIATGVALEAVVIEALRPMLRQWIDANLPAMVEKMVAREIARITAR